MGTPVAEPEFSALQFEKTLVNLKDSQECINQCCQWCLVNRQHYKKIVNSWLNVIKRVKIEQRLTLFYLANDVVQYSKRRHYEYIDTWGTAIQKATTMVRDEKVKHKILRIFKIWEQRAVYGEEFIADLCGLISVQPAGPKSDEPHEFQASYVINKIKTCSKLEKDTDSKLKQLKEHNPKIQISEGLVNSLKERARVDDVEKELDVYVEHTESYINALKLEIKNRIALISALKQAESQLESDRKDVKTVAHAYKTFGQRIKTVQKKLEEHRESLSSPIPSPDINAPSPSPEEDIDLPEDDVDLSKSNSTSNSIDINQYTNPGFYVPPPSTNSAVNNSYNNYNSNFNNTAANSTGADTSASFLSNGFTSFLGQNVSFDISNMSGTGAFSNSVDNLTANNTQTTNSYVTTVTAVSQTSTGPSVVDLTGNETDNPASYNPLLPPPLPLFSKNNENNFGFSSGLDMGSTAYDPSFPEPAYSSDTAAQDYDYQNLSGVYPPSGNNESYAPSHESWNDNSRWDDVKESDTPESPPTYEKEGYADPVEYHDSAAVATAASDVDHRILPGMNDLEDSLSSLGGKDVDHRNLISLTGSPNTESPANGAKTSLDRGNLKTLTSQNSLWESADRDYRRLKPQSDSLQQPPPLTLSGQDQDYRLQFNLKAPPPPPPPPKSPVKRKPPPPPPLPAPGTPGDPRLRYVGQSLRKTDDVVDMDLSDDLDAKSAPDGDALEPPPPLPDLLDDVDANQFLDEISNELNEFSDLATDLDKPENDSSRNKPTSSNGDSNPQNLNSWGAMQPPLPMFGMAPPGTMGFPPGLPSVQTDGFGIGMNRMNMSGPPQFPPPPNWMEGGFQPSPAWTTGGPNNTYPNNEMYEDNPYLNEADGDYSGFPNNGRGGYNFVKNPNFRGRGRGRGGGRGRGNGNVAGGPRAGHSFRPRGYYRRRGR